MRRTDLGVAALRWLLAAALCSLVAACQRAPEVASKTPVARTPRPQHLTTATISDPKTFNPILVADSASNAALDPVFEGLVRLNPLTTGVEPMLAASWEYNADGTECTFHLRKGVRWQDGAPFTAADVAFTLDAIYSDRVPNGAKRILLIDGRRIRSVIVDDHTIKLVLPRPFAPLLNALVGPIVPKHLLGESLETGDFARQWGVDTPPEKIVGTGPFRMTSYVKGQYIQYRRNGDYWMKDERGVKLPYLEEQTLLIVPNQGAMYREFLAGRTDIHYARPEEVPDLRAHAKQMGIRVVETGLDTGTTFVSFNRNPVHYQRGSRRDPRLSWFTDRHFLLAIAHAIDKQRMVRESLYGFGKPAVAEISPENKIYHDPNLTDYDYDLDEARRLLAEGGYRDRDGDGVIEDRDGNKVEFRLNTNTENAARQKMCSILREDWTKLGMKVDYRPLEFSKLVEKLDASYDWDAVLIGFTGGVEPQNSANILQSSNSLHLWDPRQRTPATQWEKEIDDLVEAGSRELNLGKRKKIYWRIQGILHEELPMIQTVRQMQFVAYRDYVENFRPTVWGVYRPERIKIAE